MIAFRFRLIALALSLALASLIVPRVTSAVDAQQPKPRGGLLD
jgi:hypothetical protein